MLKSLTFYLFFIVTVIFLTPAQAVEVTDLYQASVAINSQTSGDRPSALKKALAAVMVKVGGKKSVLDNAVIKSALKNHQQYLSQYRYQNKPVRIDSSAQSTRQQQQLFLIASFNEKKINSLFQQANLPLWGSLRPQVLLWLVEEQGFTRTIMANSTNSDLPFMVHDFSARRGLPMMMPLMDLTDASQLTISDIWGRFEQPVRAASARYFAEAIVVMRISNASLISQEANNSLKTDAPEQTTKNCGLLCIQPQQTPQSQQDYVLDWSLITNQQTFSQQYQGKERQELLQQGLDDITEQIYQYYALSTTSQHDFVIEVANVDSLATYAKVFDFLSNLSAVKSVALLSAKGQSRRFQLQLLGSVEALLASLKLNKQLKQYIDPLADINNETGKALTPVFYWGEK